SKMCCTGFLKTMMFVFNGVIFLAGVAILGVGIWVQVDSGSLTSVVESIPGAPPGLDQLSSVSYVLIAVGAVLLVIGFLGCCGAVRESRCMLLTVS
uniref:TSN18 protein n=1 Tax=Periophthalmus magnuspinnatus TaxID=409849 RepID=A0A3B4BJD3_9GOBI